MAIKTTQPRTDEERAERRRADREFARAAVEQLRRSERWQAWLVSRASFRTYSVGNQILIAVQHPDATQVTGFRKWLQLGYAVRRGERAIRIWAPCPPSRKQIERWQQQGSDPDRKPRTYFRLAAVFAQDQVAALPPPARPLPLDPPVAPITGEQLASVIPALVDLAGEVGSTVTFEAMTGGRHGYYNLDDRRIAVDQDLSGNGRAKTLIHELGHALLRAEPAKDDPKLDRAGEELVVESIAFTVTRALGLDSSGYSVPYLASWSQTADLSTIEKTAGVIDRIARRIEDVALTAHQCAASGV